MLVAMNQAGMSPYEHFHQYWAESFASKGVFHNPSQSFDTAAYMNAKLAEMQKGDPAYTMEMLVKDFQDAGLDPIQHYEMYGKAEGLSRERRHPPQHLSAHTRRRRNSGHRGQRLYQRQSRNP